jgi:CRP-like cAMP-binding protein
MLEIFEDDFDVLRNVLRALSAEALEARRKLGAHAGFSNVVAKQPAVSARPLDLVQRMAAIRSTMPFVESHLDAIADLAQEARELRAPPGHVLWRPGEQALDLLVVVAGEIECVSAERDQAFRLGPGDAAGSLGAMASLHRWYEARVTESLVALSLPVEAVFDVFEDHFEMALDMIGGLASVVLRLYEDAAADGGA